MKPPQNWNPLDVRAQLAAVPDELVAERIYADAIRLLPPGFSGPSGEYWCRATEDPNERLRIILAHMARPRWLTTISNEGLRSHPQLLLVLDYMEETGRCLGIRQSDGAWITTMPGSGTPLEESLQKAAIQLLGLYNHMGWRTDSFEPGREPRHLREKLDA